MDTENQSWSESKQMSDTPPATIEIPVPAGNGDIYRYSVTDTLLSLLLDRPLESYTIRELSRLLDTTHRSVSKAVDVLADNAVVTVQSEGNKKLVQINRERVHVPDDPVFRIPQTEFHHPVQEAIETLLDELEDVLGIVLYGSVARGEADRRSDIDLWVLVGSNRSRNQRRATDVATELDETKIGGERYEFHVVVESPDSVPAYTEDVAQIVTTGIPVYETESFDQFRSRLEGMIDE